LVQDIKSVFAVNKLNNQEKEELKLLLKSDQLCFNDINEHGVHLYGVKLKDEQVGYFGYELFGTLALFRSMVVVAEAQNKGYGALIWQQAMLKLIEEGVNEVYLLTNTASVFFKKQGFEIVARSSAPAPILATTEFKEFCLDDSVCMKIKLK
jgi:amino-acid N-acetyltransferase